MDQPNAPLSIDRGFLQRALRDFKKHLEAQTLSSSQVERRIRAARQFALFVLGEPAEKHEQTKYKL